MIFGHFFGPSGVLSFQLQCKWQTTARCHRVLGNTFSVASFTEVRWPVALDYKTCTCVDSTSYKEKRKTTNKPEPLSRASANLVLSSAISFLDVPKDMSGKAGNASITAFAIYTNIQNEACNLWNIVFEQHFFLSHMETMLKLWTSCQSPSQKSNNCLY